MKTLKYAIVSAILALGIAAPTVSAQEDGAAKAKHGSSGGHDMTAALLKGITLTADQQTKVDAIKADPKAKGLAAAAKIRDVLTDEQKTTFDANVAAAKAKAGKGGSDKGSSSKGSSSKGKSKKSKGGEGGGGGDE